MQYINYQQFHALLHSKNAVLIDVREPLEFAEAHFPGAINMPMSSFKANDIAAFRNAQIIVMCQTQNRSAKVANQLQQEGFSSVYILQGGMSGLLNAGFANEKKITGWSIDRQFRLTLGVLLAIFLAGYFWVSWYFIAIPVIISCGLVFTALIDQCYMRQGIAMLPWNKGKRY